MEKKYDAFITYRGGPDGIEANALYQILVNNGLEVAIDSLAFSPAETFLDEMARCVSESRYTIALISSRYATSHFPQEEAIMQQILDNREKQRRFIVAYIEDYPAPLWMQSRVGVRLFQDRGTKTRPELKKLIKLLMLKGKLPSKEEEIEIDRTIDSNWRNLPKQIVEFGIYGLATYGVISALADMNLDVAKEATLDAASSTATEAAIDHTHAASEHISDNIHGIATGIGKVIRNIFDDLW